MSGYQPIPKRASSPFSTRDQLRQKQLQKQTERILLTNQRSNQSIVTQMQTNIDFIDDHTTTSPQTSPRSKISNESFRINTLTSLKRENSPESIRNLTKQMNNPISSPSIPSLVHIPQEQQDHINLGHKSNGKSNSISNNGGYPLYEETPKFKINKTENILSFHHRPLGSSYLEENTSSKEDACGSCFSFGHEDSRDEDKIASILQRTPGQTSLTAINIIENSASSQVQHIQQGATKKHVSFCPQIDKNIQQEKQQLNPQHQLITLKSCLGDKQYYHKDDQISNIEQPIEIREKIIINQPIFESFAPQVNFSSNQGFNQQLEIVQSQPQELTNPAQEQKKQLDFSLRIRKESITEEIYAEDISKMEVNAKLNMLRERMVKPQADSNIAKYIQASCIKKASSLEFIDIPSSSVDENAKKNECQEQERIPYLIYQLKSNLTGDSQKIPNDMKQNQQYILSQYNDGLFNSIAQLRNRLDNQEQKIPQEHVESLKKQDGEIINSSTQIKTNESQNFHKNSDEIVFQQPYTGVKSEKLDTIIDLLGEGNQKQNNNSKKTNTNSNYVSQDISSNNADNLQMITPPACKTAVITLSIKPILQKEGFQVQQQTSSEESQPLQQLIIYTGTIHLEPLITKSKMAQMSPIKKCSELISGECNRTDNPLNEKIELSQTPKLSLDLKSIAFKINEDFKNDSNISNDNGTTKNKQILLTQNSAVSSIINSTTMASNDETVMSLYSSEVAATSSSPQPHEYFSTSYLKPSPMPIINGQITKNLHLKSSNTFTNFNNTNSNKNNNKQDPCSSPSTSYQTSPKKQSKKQPMDSLRLDCSLDFYQKNLAQDKSVSAVSRPQPACQPSPSKAYSQLIRQSFFQYPQNHNFNHSQENIQEDSLHSKQKGPSTSKYISQSSSLIRSSSPSKLKQNPYDIQPQTIKSSTKISPNTQHKSNYSYCIKSGYQTKNNNNDSHSKSSNSVIGNKTSGSYFLSQTKIDQEFSYYQLSQNNLPKGQTPQSYSSFNSEVSLPFH